MQKAFTSAISALELENNLFAFRLGRELFFKRENSESLFQKEKNDSCSLLKESVRQSILPWQNKSVLLSLFDLDVNRLQRIFPKIKREDIFQYIHDLYVFNRNKNREIFFSQAGEISVSYEDFKLQKKALALLVRTYFIKDEIFISHIMISPVQKKREKDLYLKWGRKFRVSPINRPSFDLGAFKLEFDISPREWMLKIMRHMRILRLILPGWHKKERSINENIRHQIFSIVPKLPEDKKRSALMRVENIKGYRNVRYQKAQVLSS